MRLALFALGCAGCAGYTAASAGFAGDLDGSRPSVHALVEEGAVPAWGGPMMVGAVAARAGADVQELTASLGVALRGAPGPVMPFARADVALLQLGLRDGEGSFGMFGPHLEVGLGFSLWGRAPDPISRHTAPYVSVAAGLGYDVRYVGGSSASWHAAIGLGWYLVAP